MIADTPKLGTFMKETSAVFLDLCDSISILNNNFTSNWSILFLYIFFINKLFSYLDILTGDSYIGASINIYRSLSYHGFKINKNTF